MVLRADLYLNKDEPEDVKLHKVLYNYARKNIPQCKMDAPPKRSPAAGAIQPIAKRALHVAHCLSRLLDLSVGDPDELFKVKPWTDPGEEIWITASIIDQLRQAGNM